MKKLTMGEAKTIINLYKNGSSIASIHYMTEHPIETIEMVVKGIK